MTEKNTSLEITDGGQPAVPAFTCLIYVHQKDDGTVAGRVANLAGIEATGNSERAVLSKLVGAFKTQVAALYQAGQQIPWLDPPLPRSEDEQIRSVPMHL